MLSCDFTLPPLVPSAVWSDHSSHGLLCTVTKPWALNEAKNKSFLFLINIYDVWVIFWMAQAMEQSSIWSWRAWIRCSAGDSPDGPSESLTSHQSVWEWEIPHPHLWNWAAALVRSSALLGQERMQKASCQFTMWVEEPAVWSPTPQESLSSRVVLKCAVPGVGVWMWNSPFHTCVRCQSP